MNNEAAALLQQHGLNLDPTIPYNLDSMFQKTSGWGAKGEAKRIHKTVTRVEPLLKRLLRDGEEVLYVARGVQFKFSEQYFLGIWAHLINQTVFVLTNVRLLMFHVNSKGDPRHTYWLIYYNQIKKFKGSMMGNLALDLNDGTKLRFTGFKGVDRKRMPEVFEEAMQAYSEHGFNPQCSQSRENLCGKCLAVVPKDVYQLGELFAGLLKPSEVALRSLIFPSWGDFAMKHTGLAVMELIGYLVTWGVFVFVVLGLLADGKVGALAVAGVFLLMLVGVQHCIDAGLTFFIARKGLNPKGGIH